MDERQGKISAVIRGIPRALAAAVHNGGNFMLLTVFLPQLPKLVTAHPFMLVIALTLLVIVSRRFSTRNSAKKRTAVFAGMGFIEITRDEAFGNEVRAIAPAIEPTCNFIYTSMWVGKGSSAIGETLIFDVDGGLQVRHTVAGFRVPQSIPDFYICHRSVLDGFDKRVAAVTDRLVQAAPLQQQGTAQQQADETARPASHFSVHWGKPDHSLANRIASVNEISFNDRPDFAKKYHVSTSDESAMRRALSPAFTEALETMNDSNLNMLKLGGWLFVYGSILTQYPSPGKYPALLEKGVKVISLLDLRAASAAS
jgi:hypothetical protein